MSVEATITLKGKTAAIPKIKQIKYALPESFGATSYS
jgi:hypothetical protein